jgi:hypothetical protein
MSTDGNSWSALAFPCLLGAIIGLIVLNYRHSLRCENALKHDEADDFMRALERRMEVAERESASNDRVMEHLKYMLTQRLAAVEVAKVDSIFSNARAIAVQDALKLQSIMGLPFPNLLSEFGDVTAEGEMQSADDAFSATTGGVEYGGEGAENAKESREGRGGKVGLAEVFDDDYYSTKLEGAKGVPEEKADDVGSLMTDDASKLSDGERTKQCAEWLVEYKVTIGASWGELPEGLQHKWLAYHCDYFLQKEKFDGHAPEHSDDGPTSRPTSLL